MTTRDVEVTQHHTMNNNDIFSDHIPIQFQIKIDYEQKEVPNELQGL